jgi:imidazolonepropionase-like amidohydrolase
VKALTINAAAIGGAADQLGSLEKGKLANLIVTSGDLFDEKMTIKHVFIDGAPVIVEPAPASPAGGRGRGGEGR